MSLRTLWSAPALAVVGALAVTWTLATSCRTAAPVSAPTPAATPTNARATPPPPPASVDVSRPATLPPSASSPVEPADLPPSLLLRVGLTVDGARGSIGADHGVVVTSLGSKDGEARGTTVARATFLPVAGGEPTSGGGFRVQVVSLAEEGAAHAVADRVKRTVGLEPSVRRSSETRTYQVRVGEFPSRDEALRIVGRLAQAGLPGAFVVSDSTPVVSVTRIRLLETGELFEAASVLPADATDTLALDATAYRGYFEIRPGQGATVTVVNVVPLEDYLRGVVPNELSPLVYPEIEALKAQAVAARTYAIRNRGQFASRGYDICATPSCQVYRGRSSESPLSDRAVAETRGTVVSYRGAPIHALYTSTCGGHTEDGEAIFEEHGPYLKGVACLPERSGTERILTQAEPPALAERGNLSRDVALLQAVGVFGAADLKEADAAGVPRDGEVRGWIERLIAAGRRSSCALPVGASLARRADFIRTVVGALCWDERSQRLLGPADVEVLLQAPDAAGFVGESERRAAALLLHEGALSPLADGSLRPTAAVTRAQAAEILARLVEILAPPSWVEGEVAGVADGRLALHMGDEERSVLLSSRIRLFRDLDGARSAAREIHLTIGDTVRLVMNEAGEAAFLEAVFSRKGAAADRTSRYFRWEVRLSPEQVATAIARYGSVGRVVDLTPRKLGVSGRVIELVVKGETGDLVLTGMKVRWGLGLRENLFVVDREHDREGRISRFVFTGKGWGHGVGLCQVGAFGMAHAGATFQEILLHYYSGVAVTQAY